ncbi:26S proteasome non-ATPase regulatory subunit 9 [Armadillidium nasatum]|uniref:26S proteasome non-ATPase regulatory subunit 9 n=1 Tax=Armadillidium nasatum TaxID=96803 RepID=A0A5N5TB45_9CRUS|nr:26S proteasome non-ATPase regulatory subunit 9 [Armadillidium nasatum]KAB7504307.1 26S proteasome non-ATPase regulatory subunit 9 [Armadillidium nasatum]
MNEVLKLISERDKIENQIKLLSEVLAENDNVGMNGSLVDSDGYPRSDIDVYQVRHARHDIICLQNDHKALMKKIEQGLQDLHQQSLPLADPNGTNVQVLDDLKPFAFFNRVDMGSPADIDVVIRRDGNMRLITLTPRNWSGPGLLGCNILPVKTNDSTEIVDR